MTINKSIEAQARSLAAYNRSEDPAVTNVYWFPNDQQVRLVIVASDMPVSVGDNTLHPLYVWAAPDEGFDNEAGIALISSDDFGKLRLPEDWGTWRDAQEI